VVKVDEEDVIKGQKNLEHKLYSRRGWLKYTGAAVIAGAIAVAGYGITQYKQQPTPTPTPTSTEPILIPTTTTPTAPQTTTKEPTTPTPTQEEQQIRELLNCYADLYSHHSNLLPSLYTDDATLIWKFVDGNTRTSKGTYQISSFYRDMFTGAQMGMMNFKIGETKIEENRVKANANCVYSILLFNATWGLICRSNFILADISSQLDKRKPHILKSGWRIRLEDSQVYRG